MVLGVDDAAKEFGKSMGGKAAVALCDWFQRLWNTESVDKKKQYENIVKPAFENFTKIYEEYIQSFKEYRSVLLHAETKQDIRNLINQIEGDLRFTAKNRVDLLSNLKLADNNIYKGFIRSIVEFLVTNEESLSGIPEDSLAPPEIIAQVYRSGLINDLNAVLAPWEMALDPWASGPPLHGVELKQKLHELGEKYSLPINDQMRDDKLRARLAVDRLDERVNSLVNAYKKVREEYDILKKNLLK